MDRGSTNLEQQANWIRDVGNAMADWMKEFMNQC
jgi:hypothetical protein